MPIPETIKLSLPSLKSDIIGELDNTIALFRGIPYATLSQRWTQSRIQHNLDSPFDGRNYGPRCPQREGSVLVAGGVVDTVPGDDEFKCLNLNVTVPKEQLPNVDSKSKILLPVLVWIHGGSFISGSNSVARYTPQALSRFANSNGKPVIIVQINYRLGSFGFSVSKDLVWEAKNDSSLAADYISNFGLLDQRNAFLWVKDHISDFGGDPENITTIGVSAGSACIHDHILGGDPLFDRAILMSGTAGTLGPLPFELYEIEWKKLASTCETLDMTAAERLKTLRNLPAKEVVELYTKKPMGPYGDSNLLSSEWKVGDVAPLSRCQNIILGDVRHEGIILDGMCERVSQENFGNMLEDAFASDDRINEFCSTFGFGSSGLSLGDLPRETYKLALRFFFSVVIFQFPTLRVAETFGRGSTDEPQDTERSAHLYHFEEKSPWDGPTFGLAYHGQCATYLHLNQLGTETFPDASARVSENMASCWVDFMYGEKIWSAYDPQKGKDRYMRFGPDGESSLQSIASDVIRPQSHLEWVRQHWEPLQKLCRKLLFEI